LQFTFAFTEHVAFRRVTLLEFEGVYQEEEQE
jgi:hypothetical protein